MIVDRSVYRELVKQAIARTVTELEAQVAAREAESKRHARAPPAQPADPMDEAQRDRARSSCAISPSRPMASTSISAPGC